MSNKRTAYFLSRGLRVCPDCGDKAKDDGTCVANPSHYNPLKPPTPLVYQPPVFREEVPNLADITPVEVLEELAEDLTINPQSPSGRFVTEPPLKRKRGRPKSK